MDWREPYLFWALGSLVLDSLGPAVARSPPRRNSATPGASVLKFPDWVLRILCGQESIETVRGQAGSLRSVHSPYIGPHKPHPGLWMALLPSASRGPASRPSLNSNLASGMGSLSLGGQSAGCCLGGGPSFCLILQTGSPRPAKTQRSIFKDRLRHRLSPKEEEISLTHASLQSTWGISCRGCSQGLWDGLMPKMNDM